MFTKARWDKSFIFNSIRLRREWLSDLHLMQVLLRDRIVFRKAVRNGLCVLEYQERDHAAGIEVSDLYREVYGDA